MTYTNIVERAKTGDTVAIETVLNDALRIHNVTSKVAFKKDCLYIVLASSQVPQQAELIAQIRQQILGLRIDSLQMVKIYAAVWGEEGQAWHDEFRIGNPQHQPRDRVPFPEEKQISPLVNSTPTRSDRHGSPGDDVAENDLIHDYPYQNKEYLRLDTYLQTGTYFLKLDSPQGLSLEIHQPQNGDKTNSDLFQARSRPIFASPPALLYLVGRIGEVKQGWIELEAGKSFEIYGSSGLGKSAIIQHLSHCLNLNSAPKDGIWSFHRRYQAIADILQTLWDSFYDTKVNYKPTPSEIKAALADKHLLIIIDENDLHPGEIQKLQQQLPKCQFLLASSQRCLENNATSMELSGFSWGDGRIFLTQALQRNLDEDELEALEQLAASSPELDDGKRIISSPWLLKIVVWLVRECNYNLRELCTQLPAVRPDLGLIALAVQQLTPCQLTTLEILAAMEGAAMLAPQIRGLSNIENTDKVLKELVTANLVETQGDRYWVRADLGTILTHVDVANGKTQQRLEAIRRRGLKYFQAWIEKYSSLPSLAIAETDAIMTLLTWGLRKQEWLEVLNTAKVFEPILVRTKLWGLWGIVLDYMLQAARHLEDNHTWAWVLHQQGTRALCWGEYAAAQDLLNQALQLRQTIQDAGGIAVTRVNLNLIPTPEQKASPTSHHSPPVETQINRQINRDRSKFLRVWLLRSFLLGVSGVIAYVAWSILTQMESPKMTESPSSPPAKPKNPLPTATTRVGLNKEEIDFGAIAIDSEQAQQTLKITNLGSTALRIGSIEKMGDNSQFAMNLQKCSSIVAPNTSCQVIVSFNPTISGKHTGKIEITDSNNNAVETVVIVGIARKTTPPQDFSSPPPLTIMIDEPLAIPETKEFSNPRRLAPQVKPSIPPVNDINPATDEETITPTVTPEPTSTPEVTQTPTPEETPEFTPVQPPKFIPPTPQAPQSSLPTPSGN